MINFIKLKQIVRGYEAVLLRRLLPEGQQQGHEFIATNPTRNDQSLGSFKVNLCSYQWADFATGDKGGDIISLWAYVRGINNVNAATEILTIFGKDIDDVRN